MTGTAPIQLAPARRPIGRRGVRLVGRAAGGLHAVLAMAIVAAVFAQVYLIGAYVFGAGQGVLDAHRSVGFSAHGLEVLVLVTALVARLPRRDVGLSLLLAVVGTVQIALASSSKWVGGLHPLFALVVLGLAGALARRGLRRLRDARAGVR
jgi:hypothetical protein